MNDLIYISPAEVSGLNPPAHGDVIYIRAGFIAGLIRSGRQPQLILDEIAEAYRETVDEARAQGVHVVKE